MAYPALKLTTTELTVLRSSISLYLTAAHLYHLEEEL